MQPYQEASQAIRKQGELPLDLAKRGAGIASSAGAAYLTGGAINRVLPFLSKYIPEDLAIKGLNKVDPRYGSFIQKALGAGQTFEEIKDFIGSKIEDEEKKSPKEDRNIIQQYSPRIFEYLTRIIKNGSTPTEAAIKAQKFLDTKDKSIIKQIEKDHKTPWTSIVESIFGTGAQPSQQPSMPQELQGQMGQNGQNQQGGPGQQALMKILAQINQKLGQ